MERSLLFLEYLLHGSSFDLKEILYVPAEAHLWYLYAMIPIYLVLPFFQVMCRNMSLKLEKVFLIVTTGAVLFNYVLWLMGGEAYYDLPLIGDRIYAWYVFCGILSLQIQTSYPDQPESAGCNLRAQHGCNVRDHMGSYGGDRRPL